MMYKDGSKISFQGQNSQSRKGTVLGILEETGSAVILRVFSDGEFCDVKTEAGMAVQC